MKNYIFGLYKGEELIDKTSLDEHNEELAWEIMVTNEQRATDGLTIGLLWIDEE
jgi:hypothetical protein